MGWWGRGASAQAAVAGAYAWAVTVAPAAWAHGAPAIAKVASGIALLSLAGGVVGEGRWGNGARFTSLWGFVLSSGVTWAAAPFALAPSRVDAVRGIAGMVAWALFAMASSAPALRAAGGNAERNEEPLSPRTSLAGGDAAYLIGGALGAAALQVVGWGGGMSAERSLLVRLVGIAAGLAILGAATELAQVRHLARGRRPWVVRFWGRGRRRQRRGGAAVALAALVLLAIVGLVFAVRGPGGAVVP